MKVNVLDPCGSRWGKKLTNINLSELSMLRKLTFRMMLFCRMLRPTRQSYVSLIGYDILERAGSFGMLVLWLPMEKEEGEIGQGRGKVDSVVSKTFWGGRRRGCPFCRFHQALVTMKGLLEIIRAHE